MILGCGQPRTECHGAVDRSWRGRTGSSVDSASDAGRPDGPSSRRYPRVPAFLGTDGGVCLTLGQCLCFISGSRHGYALRCPRVGDEFPSSLPLGGGNLHACSTTRSRHRALWVHRGRRRGHRAERGVRTWSCLPSSHKRVESGARTPSHQCSCPVSAVPDDTRRLGGRGSLYGTARCWLVVVLRRLCRASAAADWASVCRAADRCSRDVPRQETAAGQPRSPSAWQGVSCQSPMTCRPPGQHAALRMPFFPRMSCVSLDARRRPARPRLRLGRG